MYDPVTFVLLASPTSAHKADLASALPSQTASEFFARKFSPFQGVANVESHSWPIDDRDWDWMLVPSHARQRANQRNRNVLCHVE